ncbi:hypothetical protein KBC31_03180 [Candidatus Saccharibacteria bacterium]|nr:hypothetical protein [Candidatus Saccharibacteria bacterium]
MRKIFSRLILVSLFASFAVIIQSSGVSAATYSVITNSDNGAGSFRQAITDANANPGADEITFNIPGAGPHEIVTTSYLPAINQETFINGESQPGTICGTAAMQPQIIIKGYADISFAAGSDNSSMRGVAFPNSMVVNHDSVYVYSDNFTLTCSFFGTSDGITSGDRGRFRIVDGADNVKIGTTDEADRNIFVGGNWWSIYSDYNTSGTIQNNFFGTNPAGTEIAGSFLSYVELRGEWGVTENVFAGNPEQTYQRPLNMYGTGAVTKNYIGTDKTKTKNFGSPSDGGTGIYAYSDVVIGGVDPDDKNYIYNWGSGAQGSASLLGNQFKDNKTPIQGRGKPQIISFDENGGNTEFVVDLKDGNFNEDTDYRIELFSNPTKKNSRGGLDTTTFIGSQEVTKTYSNNGNYRYTVTIPGTGYTDPTVVATRIDESANGFGESSSVGQYKIPTDLKMEKIGNIPACVEKGADFSYQVKITNNGPSTLENFEVDFYDQNGFFSDIDPQITGGTATSDSLDSVSGNSNRWLWSGSIETGQTVNITIDSTINPTKENAYSYINPSINDYNSEYYRDTNDNNGGFYQDLPVCGKQADLKLDFERVSGEKCVTPGEQDRVYRVTVTNNGPNPVDSFNLQTPYTGDGMHENIETVLSGGTATETTNFSLANGSDYKWGWQGELKVGETLIFETTLDIANNTDNNASDLRFRVDDQNYITGNYDFYDSAYNNNENRAANGNNYEEYYCGSTYNLKIEETSNNTQRCIEPNQKNRTYKIKATNDGDEAMTSFYVGGQYSPDAFENIRVTASGGTGTTTSLVDASDTVGPGIYLWTGNLAPGKTLEFTVKTDVKSPSVDEPQIVYMGAFIEDKENISSRPVVYKYESYCEFLTDVSSEIRLNEPGLIDGQPARYRLIVKNVGAKTLSGDDRGTEIIMYAYFSSDLRITNVEEPDGFNCEQIEAANIGEFGYVDGVFLICEQSGSGSLAPGQSLEFIVDVDTSQVSTNVSGLKKAVRMLSFTELDPDIFEIQFAAASDDLFGITNNSIANFFGSKAGSSFNLASTGGGSGQSGPTSSTLVEQLNALNQAYRDAQLARSGDNQQKAIGITITVAAILGLLIVQTILTRKKIIYKL